MRDEHEHVDEPDDGESLPAIHALIAWIRAVKVR
jgi:hypothetical protein